MICSIPRYPIAYAGAGAASAEYNLDLVCEGPDGDGEEDYEAQNEMIDRAIREQVDALLFSAIDFEKNAEAIDRAAKAGIRIVVVDSPVNSEAVECYIGTNNYEAGCMAGEEVLGNPAENLNIGIVNFDKSTENGQLREKGFRDTVLNDDRVNITASINVKSTITDAREGRMTDDWNRMSGRTKRNAVWRTTRFAGPRGNGKNLRTV